MATNADVQIPFGEVLVDANLWNSLDVSRLTFAIAEVGASENVSAHDSIQSDKDNDGTAEEGNSLVVPGKSIEGTTTPRAFIKFPPEIHLKIFDLLCPVNSACLGLTCKKFYQIHRSYHGTVSLMLRSSSLDDNQDGRRLGSRIRCFFDRNMHFNKKELGKYVTQKRAQELRVQRWENRDMLVDTSRMSYFQRRRYLTGFQSDDSDWDGEE